MSRKLHKGLERRGETLRRNATVAMVNARNFLCRIERGKNKNFTLTHFLLLRIRLSIVEGILGVVVLDGNPG